jgi:hypothetical protein
MTTIERLLKAVFTIGYPPRSYKEDNWGNPVQLRVGS